MNQDDIREHMRSKRRTLHEDVQAQAAQKLAQQLATLEALKPAQHVAGYLAVRGEISLAPSFELLRARGVTVYLPVLCGIRMRFAPWHADTALHKKSMGLFEPECSDDQLVSGMSLDAILVPLVAFDQQGHRIGQGGGYYDRAFEKRGKNRELRRPSLIGVAHAIQEVPLVQTNLWDVPMDYVCTDEASFDTQPVLS